MTINLILCILFVSSVLCTNFQNDNYKYLQEVKRGFDEYITTDKRPSYLNESLAKFSLPNLFRDNAYIGTTPTKEVHAVEDDIVCGLCYLAANFIILERRKGMPRLHLKNEVAQLCQVFKIESDITCDGVVELNIDVMLYIIDNNVNVTGSRVCDILLQSSCNSTEFEWTVDIPEGQSPSRPEPVGDSTFKILHVSDIHMDPLYTQGKVKSCNEPLCCQVDQEDGDSNTGNVCGYWSSYGNDVSEHLVDEMIRFANTLEFDYVYFTGDIISHRIWSTSEDNNTKTIKSLMNKFRTGFNVPVYPILGNHEPSPLNVYEFQNTATSNLSTQWLLDLVETEWSDWIPESARDTISQGGFYTVSPKEGFRLVILNSNIAYIFNWWLIESDKDPYDQLDWFVRILEQAERNNESVHVLFHHPSGDKEILKVWSREFNKIINRFANTITAQFNGHIHVDRFQVYYNESNKDQAINVAWNGASLAPYDYANPSFKIYTVDSNTFDIMDIEEWTFNLTLANLHPDQSPEWYKIYSFKDAFDLPALQPDDLGNLLIKMATNHSLLADYHIYRYKNSESAVEAGCNSDCQKRYLCQLSTYVGTDSSKCSYLQELYDQNL